MEPDERSPTLLTQDLGPTTRVKKKPNQNLNLDHKSEVVATRRSRRVKCETERARGEEYRRMRRAYQRRERMSRKKVRSRVTDPELHTYVANLALRLDPEDNVDKYSFTEDNLRICDKHYPFILRIPMTMTKSLLTIMELTASGPQSWMKTMTTTKKILVGS